MVEPPGTRPPVQAATEEELLATKLHIAEPRPGFLPRPRLLELLTEGTARELVLVCTPAGFGKTTLLADWVRHLQTPVGWLSLDTGDNDPTRFWRYVGAALDEAGAGVGGSLAPLLRGSQPSPPEAVVTALINTVASHAGQVALVLDDYHLIDAAPIHRGIALLLDRLPQQLRLVIASRADPPVPLARMRARGQLAELRAADLRFSVEETATFLRQITGLQLPADSVTALGARTEGWAAGLQLAGLSLRGQADPASFVAAFSGDHRFVLDYLTEEVLAQQAEQVVRFLLETSILEQLSGPLCDAVTGRTDSQVLLERIERASLFLVPLDETRRWWRYHHLFADLLRARLQQDHPDRLEGLHRYAAGWLEHHGHIDAAIRHSHAAGDDTWAARLVEDNEQGHFEQNEGATVERWLAALPAELVRARPQLCLAQTVPALHRGRVDEVERWLNAAERAYAAHAGEPLAPRPHGHANVPAFIAIERAELAKQRGDAEATIMFAQLALPLISEDDQLLRFLASWNAALGSMMLGHVADAEPALADIATGRRMAGDSYNAARACCTLGQVQQAQGRLGAALATCQQALERALATGATLPAAGVAHVSLAEILRERNELDAALTHASEGLAVCRQFSYAQWLVTGLTTLAWIHQARGDQGGALAAIAEAEQILPRPQVVTDLIFPAPAQHARLLLAHGQVAAAARWAAVQGLAAEDEPTYAREREYLVLARILLAQQAPGRALALLHRLHGLAAAQGRVGSVIKIRTVEALALQASGDEPGALAALGEALTLAAPGGYVRVFADERLPVASLLAKLSTRQWDRAATVGDISSRYLARLLHAFEHPAAETAEVGIRRRRVAVPGLVEQLTEREAQVLGLLATGMSNRAIAGELVVALDTVKRHVSRILDKLGVANRTQAVTRARELGLLG